MEKHITLPLTEETAKELCSRKLRGYAFIGRSFEPYSRMPCRLYPQHYQGFAG